MRLVVAVVGVMVGLATMTVAVDGRALDETGGIVGCVRDSATGRPLQGATVFIVLGKARMRTNYAGGFQLVSLSPGRYLLCACRSGYQPRALWQVIRPGEPGTADFFLPRSRLKTVRVNAGVLISHDRHHGSFR